jgi:RNase adaptor protein for sRNA GlmZ degradation
MIELLENSERELTKERDDAIHKVIRLEADVIELDAELNTLKSRYLYERRKHQTG